MKPTLLVLAAGMGSRYGGLKQMDPMGPNGETVLDYSVYDAIRAGFGRVVFIIREDFAEAFKEGVGARFADRIEVDYVFQKLDDLPAGFSIPEGRVKPWGTSHAVRAARNAVEGNFAVINADDFYGQDAYARAAAFFHSLPDTATNAIAMVGYPLENTLSDHGHVNRGICQIDEKGFLTNVEEYLNIERESDDFVRGNALDGKRHVVPAGSLVSMNFWAFGPAFFGRLEEAFTRFLHSSGDQLKSECYIPTVVDHLIHGGHAQCPVLRTTSQWFGVTYPEDKPFVVESIAKLIASGEYPENLISAQPVPTSRTAHDIRAVVARFDMRADFVQAQDYGSGHINDTYHAVFDQAGQPVRFIVQRINHHVFKRPVELMENVDRVTRHALQTLQAQDHPEAHRRTLTCIPSRDGKPYATDADGNFWRVYPFIERARGHDELQTNEQAYQVARAFGEFQNLAANLGGARLHETIPDFHHTPKRLAALETAIAEDAAGRASEVQPEIAFARARAADCPRITDLIATGKIPERVTHNDTKLNNVLLDDTTAEGICVIDLDTTMPGCALYDFGDMVRTATPTTREDDAASASIGIRLDRFEALVRGYLSSATFLNQTERDHLAFSGKLLTLECGIRFLTDYLQGDVYFKTSRPAHNLDRCRNQFAFVEAIERNMAAMEEIVARHA